MALPQDAAEVCTSQQDLIENDSQKSISQKKKSKDWLAIVGIGIEKRRKSNSSYKVENNKVVMETPSGEVKEFEIVNMAEKHGLFRKTVPIMPVPLAVIFLILNIVPGLGTFASAFTTLCGCPTEHESRTVSFVTNILVALLQCLLSPLIVGWIWSIQRGGVMVQEALNRGITRNDEGSGDSSA